MNIFAYARRLYEKYRLFVWYSAIGFTGVALDFLAFYILYSLLHLHYQYANIIGVSIGITNNFLLNAFFNFRITDKLFARFLKFYAIGFLGLGISAAALYLLIDLASITPLIAKSLTIVVVVIVQFTLNKKFAFKKSGPESV